MAGHSKFANIKHRKGAQDKKRASAFTKVTREIMTAAKLGGGDPNFNPRLRNAIIAAKAVNLPKDKVENAIKKGTDPGSAEAYDEMRYEGYGPGGVAFIVEVLTDNRNRSASDIRSILSKAGGSLGESGSVTFMFEQVGLVQYPAAAAEADAVFEAALEAGASNCESDEDLHEVTCEPDAFSEVAAALEQKFGDPETAKLSWKAREPVVIDDEEKARKILALIDTLEEHDDVQQVCSNGDVADALVEKLAS